MAGVKLYDYQVDALARMKNGCILNGGVGSGKSRTSLAYYYILNGGRVNTKDYVKMINPCDLYIITTARKRDTHEWESELLNLYMTPERSIYKNKVVIDSWNNIKKYTDVRNSFFIFDEQRVVGYGVWTKSFLQIAKNNRWVLLSATPGDTWMDYLPVFIANGFYKNKSDFIRQHVIFSSYTTFPKVERYVHEGILIKHRRDILVNMDFTRKTTQIHQQVVVDYDVGLYNYITKTRWNPWTDKPIQNAGEYCLCLRRVVNSSEDRQRAVLDALKEHPCAIIFYTYDYELEILRKLMSDANYTYSEWNGHKHEPLPTGDRWAYLVEYTAGCEGWNCVQTDTIIFYSQNYSYKVMIQASGRIDRLNTPFTNLYYYHFKSNSSIDKAITNSLRRKKKFNEKGFAPDFKAPEKKEPVYVQGELNL